ncbi:class I SAM-dependent methyltransferase [Rugamonas sp. CCM 8940]|nr:class I SAM-dependent methyltransferase [Rugamonas sp. CCM 8940]
MTSDNSKPVSAAAVAVAAADCAADPAPAAVAGLLGAGRPSRSALAVAMLRAAHQLLDGASVFADPLALSIIGPELAAEVRDDPARFDAGLARVLRMAMALRSRLAEDELAAAVARGVRQYVVLGAGLDTSAYRNDVPDLRVFELDHPATQAWKRGLLRAAGIAVPATLSLVPVDFERDTLGAALAGAGCRLDQPVFFSWLGVTLYLSDQAIFATLAQVAALPAGSGIVFDYGVAPELLEPMARMGMQHIARKYAAEGEPWKSFFDPAVLARRLHGLGFGALADVGAAELLARYPAAHSVGGGTRLMLANV